MRYKESREQSAELLRIILPLMARHTAGFHPVSYAVWYEYAAGFNSELKRALDARLAQSSMLSDTDMQELFDRHVAKRELESTELVRAQIARLVEEVDGVAAEAGNEVRQYGDELDGYRERLRADVDRDSLTNVVAALLDETTRVRIKTDTYHDSLKRSSEEVERLRGELELVQGLALSDPLSGLLNRRGFDQEILRLSGGRLRGCTVLIGDIDHFKAINDAHGHLLGDKVIVAVAQVLRSCVGERGPIARIGGEEFAIFLTHTSSAGGLELAERIRAAVQSGRIRRGDGGDSIGNVTISIGVATGGDDEAFEAILARADRALYRSKTDGRNRVTIAERTRESV
jgi:diguanylate cyclase